MASSISHDLRHSLAAIVANSEFLCDSHLTPAQREELYQEVRTGVNLMTDLIDSLLEFARTRESLSPAYANVCGNDSALGTGSAIASPASQPLDRCAVRQPGFRMVRRAQTGARPLQSAPERLRSRSWSRRPR